MIVPSRSSRAARRRRRSFTRVDDGARELRQLLREHGAEIEEQAPIVHATDDAHGLDLWHSDRRCEAPEGGAITQMLDLWHSDRRCAAPQGGAITTDPSPHQ